MKIQQYPSMLELHPGSNCRLDCSFCYRKCGNYEDGRLPICGNILKRLIADFAESGGQQLYISGGLEPFSECDAVCHALLLANRSGLESRVYTNGAETALKKSWVQELLVSTVARIRFSVHARSEVMYARISASKDPASDFTLVKENIVTLLDQRDGIKPEIGVSFVVTDANISELSDAAFFWSILGLDFMDVRFDVLAADNRTKKSEGQLQAFERLVAANTFSPMRIDMGDLRWGKPNPPERCYMPFKKIVVDRFGLVWPCCFLAQPGIRPSWACLGSLLDRSYTKIVSSISDKFPRPHCGICTPFETKQNGEMGQ